MDNEELDAKEYIKGESLWYRVNTEFLSILPYFLH
jgi:hypothetical protein